LQVDAGHPKVVDPKRIIGKMEGLRGGEAQGVADQKKPAELLKLMNIRYLCFFVKSLSADTYLFFQLFCADFNSI
jgi:hypothetical protein